MWLFLALACVSPPADSPAPPAAEPPPPANPAPTPGKTPGKAPPPGGDAPGRTIQDPSGFPIFHDLDAPAGPKAGPKGDFSAPVQLTQKPSGGYRPQIAITPDGTLHAVYYDRTEAGDIVRYRSSKDGQRWSDPAPVSDTSGRNWGPDLVARQDGSLVLTWDHAREDFSSQGWLRIRSPEGDWGTPQALTPETAYEVGSTHVAPGVGEELAYVYIGRPHPSGPGAPFQAYWRWLKDGAWSEPTAFTKGQNSAWHSNVEARPDGSVLAGWDVGPGGAGTDVYMSEGRAGSFSEPENASKGARQGERPHWAFGADGTDYVAWFHRGQESKPLAVYVRRGGPGHWGPIEEPNKGLGGFHFDPDIAINPDGVLCMVWGWDANDQAELLYSLDRGQGWSEPRRVAEINWGKPGLPSLEVDAEGRFHVVWNQGVRGYNEVYYAVLAP